MNTITVTISNEELAIANSWLGIGKLQGWLQHALDNKIRQRVDASIMEATKFNPKKMTKAEKLVEIAKVTLKSREERDALGDNNAFH